MEEGAHESECPLMPIIEIDVEMRRMAPVAVFIPKVTKSPEVTKSIKSHKIDKTTLIGQKSDFVTKTDSVTRGGRRAGAGRKPIGLVAMTAAERKRRQRKKEAG